jgi:hypothetical protein
MLLATNPVNSRGAMPLPPGLGYLLTSRPKKYGGLGATPTPPNVTVPSLLAQLGLTAQAAYTCDCSNSKYCAPSTPGACPTDQYQACAYWAASVASRFLCSPPSPWVSGATVSGAEEAGSYVALGGGTAAAIGAAAAAGSIVPIVGTLVGTIAGVITSLFSSAHAAAQKAQANAIVQGVPSANQTLQQIDAALASGQISPSQATQLYQQLQSQFSSLMQQGTSYKHGDALWVCDIAMQLIVAARKADLAAGVLTGGSPGPWTQPAPTTAVSASGASASSGTGTATSSVPSSAVVSSNGSSSPAAVDYTPLIGLGAAALVALFLL